MREPPACPHGHRPVRPAERLVLAYGRLAYSKGALKASAFGNVPSMPKRPICSPSTRTRCSLIALNFKTQTYDFELGHSNVLGGKHILS